MKNFRFIFVFLAFAGIASCSNDDDGNSNVPPDNDKILGTWKIQNQFFDGEEEPLTDCEKQTTVEFMANGTVKSTDYFADFDTEECVSEVSTQKWENRGNNVYRITEGEQVDDVTITFSNNNNTFTITAEDEDGTYSTSFIRVN
ncbi:lipocalin family protein [Antarcticibacterium sp. 1MA-6-2]|uniref:lipocalin family protein n=1 Tax=Antarcticibacterium sp. 1MA-6-2 TaxID=2908210 RepID=UPI001F159EFE|nr:lipocalin family protein [Antarcticibacterium sp. 1MA-6-2]UJH90244.1 lipocalin family protein [Antarcticibacterium sp. 1MA-6-2]